MARILRNLVLLVLTVELVLPVGWCCRPAKAIHGTTTVNAENQKSCCRARPTRAKDPAGPHCPVTPTSKCCCSSDSVVPEKVALTGGIDSMLVLPSAVSNNDVTRDTLYRVARGAPRTGPPLHVLLCVWLC